MNKKLYVGNLPHKMTNNDLQNLFKEHGTVVSAHVIMDRETNRSKGFGFVEMSTAEEAQQAAASLNQTEVDGRTLTVNEARPQTDRGNRNSSGGHRRY